MLARRRYVVLDRDGTLIVDRHYLSDPGGVELVEGAGAALRRLAALDLGLVVVTNQSGVARGLVSCERLGEIHRRMEALLAAEGVRLGGIYVCPHGPEDDCACRKPRTELLERASRELGFDPQRAFVVGDQASDVALGRTVGATTLLLLTGHAAAQGGADIEGADHAVAGLAEAASLIERILFGSP